MTRRLLPLSLALAGLCTVTVGSEATIADDVPDPLLDGGAICGAPSGALRPFLLAAAETAPFPAVSTKPAMDEAPVLYETLGKLTFDAGTKNGKAQAWFDQGIKLAFGFNHAEAQRAFREAQKLDPDCAMCFWGEALILGPNINVPMMPEAIAPAMAALEKAVALKKNASARDRTLIDALAKRYSADPKADRAGLDGAYAAAMKAVAVRYPYDDTVQVLYAEAMMDTQPWDYWEPGGKDPKGHGAAIVKTLETVLKRNRDHIGAIHLYIHAVEASTVPEKALPHANRLADLGLGEGAGHLVHMPAHIYYRIGMYRASLETNQRAIGVDEQYFKTSPSDPLYKAAYYPHNIHFMMVSAQNGGDGKTAIEAARKLDAALPVEVVRPFALLQAVKAATYTTHAQFSDPATILALPAPSDEFLLVRTMYHYARAVGFAGKNDFDSAQGEIDTLARLRRDSDFKTFDEWHLPARDIIDMAQFVATGRLADAKGDLDAAAKAYEDAIFVEDMLAYMEPPFWYYPVRQSLGSVKLRQGKLDEAEKLFRESLLRVRNNGWVLAGLAETYKRKGDAKSEKAARRAFARWWFGDPAGPAIDRL